MKQPRMKASDARYPYKRFLGLMLLTGLIAFASNLGFSPVPVAIAVGAIIVWGMIFDLLGLYLGRSKAFWRDMSLSDHQEQIDYLNEARNNVKLVIFSDLVVSGLLIWLGYPLVAIVLLLATTARLAHVIIAARFGNKLLEARRNAG